MKISKMEHWIGLPTIQRYKGLDLSSLPLNRAYVLVNTTIDNAGIYSAQDGCFQCPYKLLRKLRAHEEVALEVDTGGEASWKVMNFGDYEYIANQYRGGLICQEKPVLGDFGVYRLDIGECVIDPEVPPVQSYLPLVSCSLILMAVFTLYAATKWLLLSGRKRTVEDPITDIKKDDDRMKPLSYLRGLLLITIMFTTCGSGGYPVVHKKLGGVSVADVAFSALAWSVGAHIPLAVDTETAYGRKKWAVVGDICLRALVLIMLGLAVDTSNMLSDSTEVLWSPLKRVGVAYALAACTYALTVQRFVTKSKALIWKFVSTVVTLLWSWVLFSVLLSTFIIGMLILANFNGLQNTCFEHQRVNYSNDISDVTVGCDDAYSKMANLLLAGDRNFILDVYSYYGFSAGLIGTLSTILYAVAGLNTGVILAHFESHSDRMKLCATTATLLGVLSLVLMLIPLPMGFNMWPIASIFLISTASTYALVIVSWWMGMQQQYSSPVLSAGSSFLLILFGHLLLSKSLPFTFFNNLNSHLWCLLQNIWTVFLWMVVGEVLMQKNVKINV